MRTIAWRLSTDRGALGVRALVVALVAQAALGVLLFFVVTGRPGLGAPDDVVEPGRAGPAAATPAATAAPRVPAATVDRFDAPRALRLVRRQVAFGQRPAGSAALRRTAVVLRPLLPAGRLQAVPGHPGLRNVVGRLPGRRPALLIGAHYDTEARPRGFVGANDSAAGTAVLVEVARALKGMNRPAGARELQFALFDGEEEPAAGDGGDFYAAGLRGSKAYARERAAELEAMVLLDYVGNRGLRIPREGSSDPALWARLREAAEAVGVGRVFPPATGATLLDDHTPFLRAGVPSIDLIDFSYRYRDTLQDTVDKLDVASLDAVGETVVELVRRLDRAGGLRLG